jgi:hypothetical protein
MGMSTGFDGGHPLVLPNRTESHRCAGRLSSAHEMPWRPVIPEAIKYSFGLAVGSRPCGYPSRLVYFFDGMMITMINVRSEKNIQRCSGMLAQRHDNRW